MGKTAIAIPLILMCGCAQSAAVAPRGFSHASASRQQYLVDRSACLHGAQQERASAYIGHHVAVADGSTIVNRPLFLSCMAAKGYTESAAGPFFPPSGTAVRTTD